MSSVPPSLSVVFPAYNEAEGISAALQDAIASLRELARTCSISWFEILVVDDGSVDDTARVVEGIARDEPSVRLLVHHRNRGVGAGLRTAMATARGDVLLYTDADMPVDLAILSTALPLLDRPEVGVVAGQRSSYGVETQFREVASKAFDLIARAFFGVAVHDVNFPFKLMSLATAVRLDLRSEGALVDVELLAAIRRLGLEIVPLSIEYRSRQFGTSKTMSFRLLSKLVLESLRHWAAIRGRGRSTS